MKLNKYNQSKSGLKALLILKSYINLTSIFQLMYNIPEIRVLVVFLLILESSRGFAEFACLQRINVNLFMPYNIYVVSWL